jgi:catechol 2,3-dioxygenase-like lactoylglutathione lyase family enzyme
MFGNLQLHATLPAADLERAKAWYADKLGLTPVEEDEAGGAWYETGGARFLVYTSGFSGTNQATAASFSVDDLAAAVAQLHERGVVFEEYDMEGFQTVDGVLTLPDGSKAAWFKDSEANILAISTM